MLTIIRAYLWELWRLDRKHLVLAWAVVIGFGSLLIFMGRILEMENTPYAQLVYALTVLYSFTNAGNNRLGEDQSGFPLTLGFTRPIPTSLLVIIPLFYLAISRAAMFCVPVIYFNTLLSEDYDLFPMVWRVFTFTVICAACIWWSRNRLIEYATISFAILIFFFTKMQDYIDIIVANKKDFSEPFFALLSEPYGWQDFSVLAAWIIVASMILVYGVNRQRHGDVSSDNVSLKNQFSGFVNFQCWLPCPTSSPVKAELWREFRFKGWPVILSGIASAIIITFCALLIKAYLPTETKTAPYFETFQIFILFMVALTGVMVTLQIGANRIFDIRQTRGISTLSLFNATRAFSTTTLLGLKVIGMSIWFIISVSIIFASFWVNAAVLSEFYGLTSFWQFLQEPFSNLAWYQIAINTLIGCVDLAAFIVLFGVIQSFMVINAKTLSALLFGGLAAMLYTLVILNYGLNSELPLLLIHTIGGFSLVIGLVIYLFTVTYKDKILSALKSVWLLVFWFTYVVAYAFTLANQESFLANASVTTIIWKSLVALVPLLAILAAYRVFFLFRHQ